MGVWAFNFGHLGFVLECQAQLNRMKKTLNLAVSGTSPEYQCSLKKLFEGLDEGKYFWRYYKDDDHLRSYVMNSFVHFLIDTCASLALLSRVDLTQPYLPSFLRLGS
jgi:hypothetical protein